MEKHKARLASYVILEREGKILMTRRYNTGWMDGEYQLPAGHVEASEYPIEAAVRETKEEVGIDLEVADLEFLHVSYRINSDNGVGDYIDFFFKAKKWEGEPINGEPQKCDEINWFPLDQLPENIVPNVKHVLECIQRGEIFSEIGRS